jgi:hypothetical protein
MRFDGRRTHRSSANLLPGQLAAGHVRDDNIAFAVKAHDLHAHGASPAAFNLMLVAEKINASLATAVIQASLDQHAEHGALARVDCLMLVNIPHCVFATHHFPPPLSASL